MGVALSIDDFDRISERTPLLCDLKPGGRFVAPDLYEAGGVPLVLKRLKQAGLLHADAQTVTGRTVGEHADQAEETARQEVVRPLEHPIRPPAAWPSCVATWLPEGCVVKLAGHERRSQRAGARVRVRGGRHVEP